MALGTQTLGQIDLGLAGSVLLCTRVWLDIYIKCAKQMGRYLNKKL